MHLSYKKSYTFWLYLGEVSIMPKCYGSTTGLAQTSKT